MFRGGLERLEAICAFGHHHDFRMCLQQFAQGVPREIFVIHKQSAQSTLLLRGHERTSLTITAWGAGECRTDSAAAVSTAGLSVSAGIDKSTRNESSSALARTLPCLG